MPDYIVLCLPVHDLWSLKLGGMYTSNINTNIGGLHYM